MQSALSGWDGITRPSFNRSSFNNKKSGAGNFKSKYKAQASNDANESSSSDEDEANFTRKGKFNKKKFSKKRFTSKNKTKKVKEVEAEPEAESSESNDENEEHEGGSAMMINDESSSDESVIKKLKRKVKSLKKAQQMRNSQTELAVSLMTLRFNG